MIRPLDSLRRQSIWFWLMLALAVGLRVWIATYNTDANDNHLEVIEHIKTTGEMPVVNDCWQCYHVKGYHYPAAVLLARLSINNPVDQLRLLQYGNVLMGIVTLLLLWAWLGRSGLADRWKLTIFALIALNPRFAAINAEVTNDSLVILAGTVSFFCYARFLESRRFINLGTALLAAGLAAATKASGLVVILLLLGHLSLCAVLHPRRLKEMKKQAGMAAVILFALLIAVPFSGYVQNARVTGSPLANNIEKFPFPNWVEERNWSQAGTTSIVTTYLTFPLPALIAYPYINKSPALYPAHRNNHWAQLYGRHAFSRFERWPETWATNDYWTTRIGQAAMALSVVPLLLLISGMLSLAGDVLKNLWPVDRLRRLITDPEIFAAMTAIAMIAMSLKLSLDFQTFGIMKAIYLYPGLLGIVALLVRGIAAIRDRVRPGAMTAIQRVIIALLMVHVLDLSVLAKDLNAGYAAQVQRLATPEPARLAANEFPLVRVGPMDPDAEMKINHSYSGMDLTGGYRKFQFGFGVPSPSFIEFDVEQKYTFFETRMALADEAESTDGVIFEIWGDESRLYRGPFLVDHQVDSVKLDISNVDRLGLKVQPLGTGYGDLANWLHPTLTRKDNRTESNIDTLTQ